MSTVAIIPARGGSKGIPRKNLLPLCGRPLVAWTIAAAREACCVDKVVVSTDDAEIEAVAIQHGAEAVLRPAEISGDLASSEQALLDALQQLSRRKFRPGRVVFLQCTSPLTSGEDIDGTCAALDSQQADCALAVAGSHAFLWRAGEGGMKGVNHDAAVRLMRQQREPEFRETGAVYAMRTSGFLAARHRFFGRVGHYVMPAERCWEIDEPADIAVAEVLLRRQLTKRNVDLLPQRIAAAVFDFDGVLTDNRVLVMEDGREAATCDRSDGLALSRLKASGLPLLVLSSERNPIVARRCEKLGLPCLHGVRPKWPVLRKWLSERGIPPAYTVYAGNDVNDLDCLAAVGCGVAVADARPRALAAARLVLSACGGRGAAAELVEIIEERLSQGTSHAASA